MALLSKTSIFIAGTEVPTFKHLYLDQRIEAHHVLEVVFRMETFEKKSKEFGEKSKTFLGERMAVRIASISDKSKHGVLEFKGVVSEVRIGKGSHSGMGDEVTVIAKSKPILADDGPNYNSFNEVRLNDVVNQVFGTYGIDTIINPRYTDVIDYCVQQNESAYTFISRLAAQYGEWFYYNGEKVIFGKPESEATELQYTVDLNSFEVCLVPQPQHHEYYTNDYLTDNIHRHREQGKPKGLSAMSGFVFDKSKEIFKHPTLGWNNNNNTPAAKNQLEVKVKAQYQGAIINEVIAHGQSNNPGVKLGNIIKIEDEKYRVIHVTHDTDQSGHYQNEFTAVSGDFDAYPLTDINAFPKSESQIGVVMDNYDPEALGRIKVQFPWQEAQNKTTSWIRMMAPHAGSGKGFYCLPEVGEEVVVNFEGGNAETPYVMAGLYTTSSRPPANSATPGNDITIFMTRIGCQFIFNDNDGSITIIDKSESKIVFNGEGNITIDASANIDILALEGEINFNSPTINIGSDSETPDLTNIHGKTIHIHASQLLELLSDIELKAKGLTSRFEGTSEVVVEGTQAKVDGTALTEIKGGIVKMN